MIKLSKIKPNPNNPRFIRDHRFEKLKKSLREFPEMMELRPIIVNAEWVTLGGNMRLRALQELGYKEIPENWVQQAALSDQRQREFIVKDNLGFGDWDWDVLANEWDEVELTEWGLEFPGSDDPEPTPGQTDPDDIPENVEAITKPGDLWVLGEHRLLCGDSTNADDVARLMSGAIAEVLFTSPPYSDMRDYTEESDVSVSTISDFIPTWAASCNYLVINLGIQRKDDEIVQYWGEYLQKANQSSLKLLAWNVWDKTMGGSIASATAMFLLTHEWIFVFGHKSKKINRTVPNQLEKYEARHGKNWQEGIKEKGVRQKDGAIEKTSSKTYTHHQLHSVIQQTPELGSVRKDHPATFPVGLPTQYIEAMTAHGDVVAEAFTGSGTTMIAAEQLGRKCYGMEISPQYCDVIVKRWEDFTGKKAELEV